MPKKLDYSKLSEKDKFSRYKKRLMYAYKKANIDYVAENLDFKTIETSLEWARSSNRNAKKEFKDVTPSDVLKESLDLILKVNEQGKKFARGTETNAYGLWVHIANRAQPQTVDGVTMLVASAGPNKFYGIYYGRMYRLEKNRDGTYTKKESRQRGSASAGMDSDGNNDDITHGFAKSYDYIEYPDII